MEDFVQAVKEATQTTLNVHNAMGQASRGAVDLGWLAWDFDGPEIRE